MCSTTSQIYGILFFIIFHIISLNGQNDLHYDAKWEFRLAPHYYLPQAQAFYTENGNYLRNRGGLTGSIHLARNIFFKNHTDFYFTIQAGISYYPIYDIAFNVKNSSIPINSIPSPKKEIKEIFIMPAYFDGGAEFHYGILNNWLFIVGGIGLSIIRNKSDMVIEKEIAHISIESPTEQLRIVSGYYEVTPSDSRLLGHYNIGLRKSIPFREGFLGIGVKWVQSFTSYSVNQIQFMHDDISYAEFDYKVFMKHFEFQLILPLK